MLTGLLAVLAVGAAGMVGAAHAQPVNLEYWDQIDSTLDNPRGRSLADELRRFEVANPNIKMVPRVVPWHQIPQQLIQAAGSGRTPCVSRILLWDLPMVVKGGVTVPMDEYAARWPAAVRSDFLLGWDPGVVDKKKMAFPVEHRVFVLWYRKDLLDKAGLKVPKTVEELIQVGKTLNTGGTQGFAIGLTRAGNAVGLSEWLLPMLWASGGDLLDDKGEPAFAGPAGVRAVQVLVDLVKSGAMPQDVIADGPDNITDRFRAGRMAMTAFATHRVVTIREGGKLGENLQTAWLPGYTADKPAPAEVTGWGLIMGKDCKHREEAWKFIEHMISQETQVKHAQMTGEMPTRKSAYNDPWFKTDQAKEVRFWMSYMEKYGRTPQYPVRFGELSQLIADAVQESILRGVPPQESLKKAADRYRQLDR